jgi:hypothetical protein
MMATKWYLALFLFLTFFLWCEKAWSVYQIEYTIEIDKNGSATWTIEYSFPDGQDATFRQLSDYGYFSDTFVKNVKSLVNATREKVNRANMTVEKFVMKVSGDQDVMQYKFYWREFAETDGTSIRIGDVFEVEGLFLQGEGKVNIVYPPNYVVESVSPRPDEESGQRLIWYGTAYFKIGEPRIVLREKTAFGFTEIIQENAFVIAGTIALVGAGSISFYYYFFKLRKKGMKEPAIAKTRFPPEVPRIEDDEEKIINLLRAAGGSLYQSTLADHCGFSRSKTSKLLKTMENAGKIRREEKGREKVVTLIERNEESKERTQP